MSRRAALVLVGLAVVLLALALAWWWPRGGEEAAPASPAAAAGEAGGPTRAVDLYFPDRGGWLIAEPHEVAASTTAQRRAGSIVELLLAGPRASALKAPFPEGTELGGLYLGADGVAYVDLRSPEGAPPPASGSREEMLRVYSVVNSVSLNVDEAHRVVLLWNGAQLPSFAGHLDTGHPLSPDPALVSR